MLYAKSGHLGGTSSASPVLLIPGCPAASLPGTKANGRSFLLEVEEFMVSDLKKGLAMRCLLVCFTKARAVSAELLQSCVSEPGGTTAEAVVSRFSQKMKRNAIIGALANKNQQYSREKMIYKALYALAAFFGRSEIANEGTPGKILWDANGSDPTFSVVSCSPESLVIAGEDSGSVQPGHFLVSLQDRSDAICNPCGTLFRKVVARRANTLATTYATYEEIFRTTSHDTIEDRPPTNFFVEPLFACGDASRRQDGNNLDSVHRRLQIFVTQNNRDCVGLAGLILILGLPALVCFCIPCIPVWIAFFIICADGSLSHTRADDASTRRLDELHDWVNHGKFPSTCADWTSTHANGQCVYSGCRGASDVSDCFFGGVDEICSARTCSDDASLAPLAGEDAVANGFEFDAACGMKYVCYSSTHDKALCDASFLKTMRDACPAATGKSGAASVDDTTFPLASSTIQNNCHLLSIVYYVATKVLGTDAYKQSQREQHKFERSGCDSAGNIPL